MDKKNRKVFHVSITTHKEAASEGQGENFIPIDVDAQGVFAVIDHGKEYECTVNHMSPEDIASFFTESPTAFCRAVVQSIMRREAIGDIMRDLYI